MQRPRTPSNLSESLHQRLNSYALAASAAGVSLLALSKPAEGKIVYTHAHVVLGARSNSDYLLDLNHDGVKDFTIGHGYFPSTTNDPYFLSSMETDPYNDPSAGIVGKVIVTEDVALALRAGVKVGPSNSFVYYGVMGRASGTSNHAHTSCVYYWANSCKGVRNRYLGLKFVITGKMHYGWARVSVSKYPFIETLTGYAYETIPNKPIITGKTKGPDVVTLQDASLGHLAQGASGLSSWRKREPAAAAH